MNKTSSTATDNEIGVDILIIGAGPAGLYGAYYAGFRGLSVAVIDALAEPGGQVSAMYPEKAILDIAGFPSVKGRNLIEGLMAQAAPLIRGNFLAFRLLRVRLATPRR
ncbi:MAG: NAD(P)/FAD-dependent oxidoreductase, partial [Rhodococcus sp.]|nr:NAD(P)/FAD-dependent oxidoreductase [Rhodococcus sp. (in: high G+C Gram-positive bacteria)]